MLAVSFTFSINCLREVCLSPISLNRLFFPSSFPFSSPSFSPSSFPFSSPSFSPSSFPFSSPSFSPSSFPFSSPSFSPSSFPFSIPSFSPSSFPFFYFSFIFFSFLKVLQTEYSLVSSTSSFLLKILQLSNSFFFVLALLQVLQIE